MKSDFEIQQDVLTELRWQPFVSAAHIGVAVKNGIVTLSGQVDSYAQKLAAEKAARNVAGVKAIAEDIQIGVSPAYKKTDTEIAASVLNALKWHSAVPDERVQVRVEDGIVTLQGEVDWDYQRIAARHAVSNLLGVKDVINLITVKPPASVSDVKNQITAAFHRRANLEADRIRVEVSGSRAVLKGIVRTWAEKQDAEDAAWCAPGIAAVVNELQVEPLEVYTF